MDGDAGTTRETLEALTGRMLDAGTRETPPPAGEERDWLYGSAGVTKPDEHGLMVPLPSAHVWVPRELVFWHMVVRAGAPSHEDLPRDPRHSLARWPAIDAAVRQRWRQDRQVAS